MKSISLRKYIGLLRTHKVNVIISTYDYGTVHRFNPAVGNNYVCFVSEGDNVIIADIAHVGKQLVVTLPEPNRDTVHIGVVILDN